MTCWFLMSLSLVHKRVSNHFTLNVIPKKKTRFQTTIITDVLLFQTKWTTSLVTEQKDKVQLESQLEHTFNVSKGWPVMQFAIPPMKPEKRFLAVLWINESCLCVMLSIPSAKQQIRLKISRISFKLCISSSFVAAVEKACSNSSRHFNFSWVFRDEVSGRSDQSFPLYFN